MRGGSWEPGLPDFKIFIRMQCFISQQWGILEEVKNWPRRLPGVKHQLLVLAPPEQNAWFTSRIANQRRMLHVNAHGVPANDPLKLDRIQEQIYKWTPECIRFHWRSWNRFKSEFLRDLMTTRAWFWACRKLFWIDGIRTSGILFKVHVRGQIRKQSAKCATFWTGIGLEWHLAVLFVGDVFQCLCVCVCVRACVCVCACVCCPACQAGAREGRCYWAWKHRTWISPCIPTQQNTMFSPKTNVQWIEVHVSKTAKRLQSKGSDRWTNLAWHMNDHMY